MVVSSSNNILSLKKGGYNTVNAKSKRPVIDLISTEYRIPT